MYCTGSHGIQIPTISVISSHLSSLSSLTKYVPENSFTFHLLEGWRAAITVGTNDGPLTRLSNRY